MRGITHLSARAPAWESFKNLYLSGHTGTASFRSFFARMYRPPQKIVRIPRAMLSGGVCGISTSENEIIKGPTKALMRNSGVKSYQI